MTTRNKKRRRGGGCGGPVVTVSTPLSGPEVRLSRAALQDVLVELERSAHATLAAIANLAHQVGNEGLEANARTAAVVLRAAQLPYTTCTRSGLSATPPDAGHPPAGEWPTCSSCQRKLEPSVVVVHDGRGGVRHVTGSPVCRSGG